MLSFNTGGLKSPPQKNFKKILKNVLTGQKISVKIKATKKQTQESEEHKMMTRREKEETRNGMTFDEMLEAFEKGYGISSTEDMLELAGVDPKELYDE